MERKRLLGRLRYHWHSYVARGGYNKPSPKVGRLERGGVEHWTHLLMLGRKFTDKFPKDWEELSKFLPMGVVMLLTGESNHDYYRRKRAFRMGIK